MVVNVSMKAASEKDMNARIATGLFPNLSIILPEILRKYVVLSWLTDASAITTHIG